MWAPEPAASPLARTARTAGEDKGVEAVTLAVVGVLGVAVLGALGVAAPLLLVLLDPQPAAATAATLSNSARWRIPSPAISSPPWGAADPESGRTIPRFAGAVTSQPDPAGIPAPG